MLSADQTRLSYNITYQDLLASRAAALVTDLIAEKLYVQIHSTLFTAGEIRRQVVFGPTPTHSSTWGRIRQPYR